MSANWPHHRSGQQQAMTDFAGQKLVVVGGSSATRRDTATDLPDRMQMERVRQQLANGPSRPAPSACSQPPLGGRRTQIEVRS
jgi:hypothetical protein